MNKLTDDELVEVARLVSEFIRVQLRESERIRKSNSITNRIRRRIESFLGGSPCDAK